MPVLNDERWESIRRKASRGLEKYGVESDGTHVKLTTLPTDPIERLICKGLDIARWASYEACLVKVLPTSGPQFVDDKERIGDSNMVKALSILSEVIGALDNVSSSVRYLGDLHDWRGEILAWIRVHGVRAR